MTWFNGKKLKTWMTVWLVVFAAWAAASYINAPEGRAAFIANPGVELSIWVVLYIVSALIWVLLYVCIRAIDYYISKLFRRLFSKNSSKPSSL